MKILQREIEIIAVKLKLPEIKVYLFAIKLSVAPGESRSQLQKEDLDHSEIEVPNAAGLKILYPNMSAKYRNICLEPYSYCRKLSKHHAIEVVAKHATGTTFQTNEYLMQS